MRPTSAAIVMKTASLGREKAPPTARHRCGLHRAREELRLERRRHGDLLARAEPRLDQGRRRRQPELREPAAQPGDAAFDPRVHGRDGAAEQARRLLELAPLLVSEHQRAPQLVGQVRELLTNEALRLESLRLRIVHGLGPPTRRLLLVPRAPPRTAQPIERQLQRQSPQRPRRVRDALLHPEPQEKLLGHVLGVTAAPQHAVGAAVDRSVLFAHQPFEGPSLDPCFSSPTRQTCGAHRGETGRSPIFGDSRSSGVGRARSGRPLRGLAPAPGGLTA